MGASIVIIYHYCSAETFKSIIKSKVLWMTDLTKSNDKEEVSITYQKLWNSAKAKLLKCSDLDKDILAQTIKLVDHEFEYQYKIDTPFGVCFCLKPDLHQQWLEYGDRTRGLSLGFDLDWFDGIKKDTPHPAVTIRQACGCYPVAYYSEVLEDQFAQLCHTAIKQYGIQACMLGIMPTFRHYSAFIKNASFKGEEELRIVYYPSHMQSREDNPMGLSELVSEPYPHYCLPWAKENSCALREAIAGCNCKLTESEIRTILLREQVPDEVKIVRSQSSYRVKED